MCADLSTDERSKLASWRKSVVRILRTNDPNCVIWRFRARSDAGILFPTLLTGQLDDALASVIDSRTYICARKIESMNEAGTVYELLFRPNKITLYSKINLMPDGRIIIIYSFHIAERDTL